MRGSYGKFILPAAIAAASSIALAGTAEAAGGYGGSRHHPSGVHAGYGHGSRGGHGGHGGYGGYGGYRGHGGQPRFLPTLPVLVEPAGRAPGAAATAVRVPGVPDPVPQAAVGSYDVRGYEGYGLPTALPGVGTYVGGISAVASPGNGNYFTIDGSIDLAAPARALPPSAKIIDVGQRAENEGCDMQHGVCIIRP